MANVLMNDCGRMMDLDSSKKHTKKNNRSSQPVRTAKPMQSEKVKQTAKSGQTSKPSPTENSKRKAKSKQIAKPVQTAKSRQDTKSKQTAKLGQTDQLALSEQIARITEMEALFTQCEEAVRHLRQALENKASVTPDLTNFTSVLKVHNADLKDLTPNISPQNSLAQSSDLKDLTSSPSPLNSPIQIQDLKDLTLALSTLEAYYTSPAWRTDFEADEAGLLPPDLKRGVLSEDGIYNLLDEYKRVEEEMKEMMEEN